ncbi:lysine-specific permease [Cutibacterium acnes JCM 18918]|nr:lysine-specific permease [Cutibacterium acnes JCM 18918]
MIVAYISIPVFLALWVGHKIVTKAPHADLSTPIFITTDMMVVIDRP